MNRYLRAASKTNTRNERKNASNMNNTQGLSSLLNKQFDQEFDVNAQLKNYNRNSLFSKTEGNSQALAK